MEPNSEVKVNVQNLSRIAYLFFWYVLPIVILAVTFWLIRNTVLQFGIIAGLVLAQLERFFRTRNKRIPG